MMPTAKAYSGATPPPYTNTTCIRTTNLYLYACTAIAHIIKNYILYLDVYFLI
jgi:hypothetical protein